MYGRRPDVSKSPEKIPTDDAYPGIKIVTGPSKGLFNSLHLAFLTRDLKSTCSAEIAGVEAEDAATDRTTKNYFKSTLASNKLFNFSTTS